MPTSDVETIPIEELRRVTRAIWRDLAIWHAKPALKEYNPNQPRIPQGEPGGGRWAGDGTSGGATAKPQAPAERRISMAARRASRAVEAECERQYAADMFHCEMVGLATCRAQAFQRYAACLRGHPIPPLSY